MATSQRGVSGHMCMEISTRCSICGPFRESSCFFRYVQKKFSKFVLFTSYIQYETFTSFVASCEGKLTNNSVCFTCNTRDEQAHVHLQELMSFSDLARFVAVLLGSSRACASLGVCLRR